MISKEELNEIGFYEIESNSNLWYANDLYEIRITDYSIEFVCHKNESETGLMVEIQSISDFKQFLKYLK